MKKASLESGQALILIVFAIVGLVGLTGLAVDGGLTYSDRRRAQNAADNSALAAALANFRDRDPVTVAKESAANGGFNNNGTTNAVTVTIRDVPADQCEGDVPGKDITVQIMSKFNAYFAPVVGIRQLVNTVTATARACGVSTGPLFNGDAIVALRHDGIGFNAVGTANWLVEHGGIFSNSSDRWSARCVGNTDVIAPSVTVVGDINLRCRGASIGTETTGATQYQYADYSALLPRRPACNGRARQQGTFWVAEAGKDGSTVAFNGGDMRFAPGLFCVTNSPGPYHGNITGNWVTFYIVPTNFNIKFNGGGSLTATAPLYGEYTGILMFSRAVVSGGTLQQTQSIDLRGNGTGDVTGSIIVPSASVTMYGNSNSNGYHTQVIAYDVSSGGNADIHIDYQAEDGFQSVFPAWLTLLR